MTRIISIDDMNMTAASTTQSLDRALNLLDHVVIHAKTGISLADLAERAHLSKPTAHRLLTGLRRPTRAGVLLLLESEERGAAAARPRRPIRRR